MASVGDYRSGGDGCNDGGRFAALWAEDERHEEKIVRGAGLMAQDEADFRFDALRRNGQTEQEAVAEAAAVQEEASLTAALATAERDAMYEAMHGPGAVARSRDRARAGWDRVTIAVSELSWRTP